MTVRIKLENPGDEATFTIASVSHEDIGGYAYWKIADAEREFVIPQKSLDAQIDRAGVATAPEMVGKTVKFSRSIKLSQHKKPYWNVDLVTNGAKPKSDRASGTEFRVPTDTHKANKPEPELPPLLRNAEAEDNAELAAKIGVDLSGIQKQLATYQAVAEWTVKTLPPIFGAGKDAVGMTPESLAACTNTIFINAAKK